ncbi:MAG: C2 family cysteine protease [Anaerolineae bacterium]|nr:C2 family cysteine protease [Anaerolineae bacterium]
MKKAHTTTAGYEKLDPKTPLFEKGQPNANDVKQGGIGDCYLMAALSSLAQQQPQYIKQIMVDQGDKVSVRLYEVDQTNPANHTFTAKYLTIEKSIAKLNGSALYNKGALWVSMMEKAYAAGGFTGTGKAPTSTTTTTMDDIDGGFSRHAFEVLTGTEARSASLQGGPQMQSDGSYANEQQTGWKGNQYWRNFQGVNVPWDAANIAAYNTIKIRTPTR